MAVQKFIGEHLSSEAEWEQALERSNRQPVFLFKHSATCPISARAWKEWQSFVKDVESRKASEAPEDQDSSHPAADTNAPHCMYLIVQDDRPISNLVAERLHVRHESPQAILIHRGRPIWHASHHDITHTSLMNAWS